MSHVPAERCLSIIELLADGARALALGDIAEQLAQPKSGVHRLLSTLVAHGWVEQEPQTGFYRLTMRMTILGQRFYTDTGIPDLCQPILDELASNTREYVRLGVVAASSLNWLAHAQGATGGLMYQPSQASGSVTLCATASGKAWLSTLDSSQAIAVAMKEDFGDPAALGPNAIRSMDLLMQEVAAAGQRGYGLAINEAEPGVCALAVAIRPAADAPAVGTVSVAGPSIRLTDAKLAELAPLVMESAQQLARIWPLRHRLGSDRLGTARP